MTRFLSPVAFIAPMNNSQISWLLLGDRVVTKKKWPFDLQKRVNLYSMKSGWQTINTHAKICHTYEAKATAKSVAEMSKAAVDHFGDTSCPITSRLATVNTKRAEDECHKLQLCSWSVLVCTVFGVNMCELFFAITLSWAKVWEAWSRAGYSNFLGWPYRDF